uniref:Uncharacterized protein n=1 Tax=Romanomermis culicivorax TaxID=13658 RepID=A0A915J9Z5_ROMCU
MKSKCMHSFEKGKMTIYDRYKLTNNNAIQLIGLLEENLNRYTKRSCAVSAALQAPAGARYHGNGAGAWGILNQNHLYGKCIFKPVDTLTHLVKISKFKNFLQVFTTMCEKQFRRLQKYSIDESGSENLCDCFVQMSKAKPKST